MAAVLNYAADLEAGPCASMYSYFQPASTYDERRSDSRPHEAANSLNETSQRTGPDCNPEQTNRQQTMMSASLTSSTQEGFAQRGPNLQESEGNVTEAEVDLNADRRKRRRTTPVVRDAEVDSQSLKKTSKPPRGTIAWFPKAKEQEHAVSNAEIYPADDQHLQEPLRAEPSNVLSESDTGRPGDLQGKSGLPVLGAKDSMSSRSGISCGSDRKIIVNDVKRVTPKKKKISLNSNGTLLSSPQATGPSQSVLTAPNPTKKTGPARNMKMRHGKFIQSMSVALKYGSDKESRQIYGSKVDQILASVPKVAQVQAVDHSAKTHPFFLGKINSKATNSLSASDVESVRDTDLEREEHAKPKDAVAWSNLKFSNSRTTTFKSIDVLPPIWPPLCIQHVGYEYRTPADPSSSEVFATHGKVKAYSVDLEDQEDILRSFGLRLKQDVRTLPEFNAPVKHLLSASDMIGRICNEDSLAGLDRSVTNMRSRAIVTTSAFDRGEAAEPQMWPVKYIPSGWEEVLQPTCHILHDWLRNLAVHNVKSGVDASSSRSKDKLSRKKKRLKRSKDELDDFIVDSETEEALNSKISQNSLLITGPPGCGKTASVYAIAKELGFEVFEIHPGMRRSAKDILDKVGDMTHNHLVQGGNQDSRHSSVAPADPSEEGSVLDDKQASLKSFLAKKNSSKQPKALAGEQASTRKEQKQSLILLEEVDILFEEDKAFWSGVQNLIQHSKRPVVMTCNDISKVPVTELDLYTILRFTPPDIITTTEYLFYLAAAEGHIIDRAALSTLYASKRYDLRASITELNFWCQMTVGSIYGGLDWIMQSIDGKPRVDEKKERLRVFSQDTYRRGLDVLPEPALDEEQILDHVRDQLSDSMIDWCEDMTDPCWLMTQGPEEPEDALQQFAWLADARSTLDLVDTDFAPRLASTILSQYGARVSMCSRDGITSMYVKQLGARPLQISNMLGVFEPVTEEKPTFPPSHGRLAPSLDSASPMVATDIAPYIRSIVSYDQRLEQHREETYGSQGSTTRNTRAARAAIEGGDKSVTRSERWFPKGLDFDLVLRTGNGWPEWTCGGESAEVDMDVDMVSSQENVDDQE